LEAERIAGGHDGHDAQTVQFDAVNGALIDPPTYHGMLAGQVHFGVGEARSGVNVASAGLDIFAGQLSGASRSDRDNESCRSHQEKTSHGFKPPIEEEAKRMVNSTPSILAGNRHLQIANSKETNHRDTEGTEEINLSCSLGVLCDSMVKAK